YEMATGLGFRRVLFRSLKSWASNGAAVHAACAAAQAACTAAPFDVQLFSITATAGQNILEWVNPASGAPGTTVRVNYRTDTYPTGPGDAAATVLFTGRPVTFGAKDTFTHTGLTNGTTYYYAIWVIY